eukprot:gene44626-biopygen37959
MLAANGGYVYVLLNYNSQIIFLMQVAMALFKLCWNDFALRGMMRLARRIYTGVESRETIYGLADVFKEMPTMTFIVLFNTIIAPCLATASVDPQCFVNAVIQPTTVTTTFPSISCEVVDAGYDECGEELQTSAMLYIGIDSTMFNMIKPSDKAQGRHDSLLFHKERFTLHILSKLAVFFTFGVVFPPLAIVICAALISETYLNQIVLGRFLEDIKIDSVREKFAKKLHKDCE